MKLEEDLRTYFGYTTFRTGQKEIISTLLKERDCLAMLPTGTGKSICYQLPALLSAGTTIIVSPLLSLMEDQVQQLRSEGIKSVVALNSFMIRAERDEVLRKLHTYKMIYISPEMLQVEFIQKRLAGLRIAYFVIDEAHCISQWGHDFRPDYLRLGQVRKLLGEPPCLAVTATATKEVQEDICTRLAMKHPVQAIYSVDRPIISYRVEHCTTIQEKMVKLKELIHSLSGPGMIYFSSRMWAEKCARILQEEGVHRVAYYHGGLTTEDRLLIQQQFMNGEIDVICCTSAFGMGINKKDIRYVIHFHYPADLESYVQEIGRAARDGKRGLAILLYSEEDRGLVRMLAYGEQLTQEQLRYLLEKVQECQTRREEESLIRRLGIDDTVWRAIRYQLEMRGVIVNDQIQSFSIEAMAETIRHSQLEHLSLKKKKLHAFEQWIEAKSCRREGLLSYFSESLKEHPDNCCDHCGASETFLVSKKEQVYFSPLKPWKELLANIFNTGVSE
ncbi:ATP-dependent DNA helicase RecQ [bacterium LRH843]|nr:ATP-dependent DNA helicase RecQ [bacterium LRH843]